MERMPLTAERQGMGHGRGWAGMVRMKEEDKP